MMLPGIISQACTVCELSVSLVPWKLWRGEWCESFLLNLKQRKQEKEAEREIERKEPEGDRKDYF